MRTRAALLAAATLTGLLAAPTSAAVVAETCQGLPATIVANPRGTTFGTEGDDVIVGRGATIDARGGNDVICLDSGEVAAGDGNDSVLVTGTDRDNSVSASLGAGDDRYVGGRAPDFIYDETDIASPGSDTISTGAGADIVTSASGAPYHLVVDLGAGEDLLNLDAEGAGSTAQVQGGTVPTSCPSGATLPTSPSTLAPVRSPGPEFRRRRCPGSRTTPCISNGAADSACSEPPDVTNWS